jgi:hypothetical protein
LKPMDSAMQHEMRSCNDTENTGCLFAKICFYAH